MPSVYDFLRFGKYYLRINLFRYDMIYIDFGFSSVMFAFVRIYNEDVWLQSHEFTDVIEVKSGLRLH